MSVDARLLTLKSASKLSVDLAFDNAAVIENADPAISLGSQVTAYLPRASLYGRLGQIEVGPEGRPTGRLVFDSKALRTELLPKAVLVLDNDEQAAELDQAIFARQNDWLTLYGHVEDIFAEIGKDYKDKIDNLALLRSLLDQHHDQIEAAYVSEAEQTDPQKLIDNPKHDPAMRPTTINTIKLSGVGTLEIGLNKDYDGNGRNEEHVPYTHGVHQAIGVATKGPGDQDDWTLYADPAPKLVAQQITSIVQSDQITNPRLENHMRRARMVADLSDELLTARVFAKRLPYLTQIWKNELAIIDLEIRKLQLAYIATFLLSPFDGRLTTLYKQPGERARAGEPIARVESDASLLLFGQIVCPAAPIIGQAVKIMTKHAYGDTNSPTITLNGKIISAKGVDNFQGRWGVTFEVANTGANAMPPGYDFDPDPLYTTVSIG